MSIKNKYHVERIPFSDCKEWLLYKHYAKRIPSISYTFGLFDNGKILQGVCTFGMPPSSTLVQHLLSGSFTDSIIELNRLIVNDKKEKNVTSFFVSSCLKLLPRPLCIISYADSNQNHSGYIYQATNFIYTGVSSSTPNWYVPKLKKTIHNKWVSKYKKLGFDLIKEEQEGKHRYIYFIGNKKEKKEMLKALKYKIQPYPKGENKNYDVSYQPEIQQRLF